ncbi:hypothetical protein ACFR9U_06885 [Halorientalis brevis]|uniref:Amphi-Trp domain-containing protein n=1 Tax=Halorientalis brevis TaxID=1126241 RepID=A0ABD6CB96_9EURY|nr:hypothetical protein [Halorientalis brevis]
MSEETTHERMQRYEVLAEKEREFRKQKTTVLDDVGEELIDAVEQAIEGAGVAIEVDSTSRDGTHQTLRARLDRAALVAAVTTHLPDGFVVEHVNDDGTLTVQWDEREGVSEGRRAAAVLKAIVAEETTTDRDGLFVEVPTREQVVTRATALGIDEDLAERRLAHLSDMDVVDVVEDEVYPDRNFSKF